MTTLSLCFRFIQKKKKNYQQEMLFNNSYPPKEFFLFQYTVLIELHFQMVYVCYSC